MIDKSAITVHPLSEFLTEYKELNSENLYKPVAVGRYGIRTRESIYSKELAVDYSKNRLIYKGTLTVGMGSVQMDIGILSDDVTYSVSPAYHTYKIHGVDYDYLRYCLQCRNMDMFTRYMKRGSRQGKSIDLGRWIGYEIPIYPHEMQLDIVDRLNRVQAIIDMRQQELQKLDNLVKARFVEMFGDPVINPMDWPTKPLLEMGYCKNGMNFHTGDSGIEMHCLGVGDFKDYSVIDGTDYLPTISLNEAPPEESMLQDGDLVFVRSNGNKALVGRCLLVYPHNTPTTYSGFCIRYRLTSAEVNIVYLLRVLKTDSMRKKMAGRGANIQNLNQQILAALNIPTPPLELQERFTAFVEQIDKSKVVESIHRMNVLFNITLNGGNRYDIRANEF